MEIDNFINPGYGWLCKHCDREVGTRVDPIRGRARFFAEGEAEEKEPSLSTPAMARWRDASRQTLFCPICGVEERVDKS